MFVQSANGGVLIVVENDETSEEYSSESQSTETAETEISANLLISPILSSVVAKKTGKDIDLQELGIDSRNILYTSPVLLFEQRDVSNARLERGPLVHFGSIAPSGP